MGEHVDLASGFDMSLLSLASHRGSAAGSAKRKVVQKSLKCKGGKGQQRAEIAFPSHQQLEDLCGGIDLAPFAWSQKFVQRAQAAFPELRKRVHNQDVSFLSEFSGSGCAECALQSVMSAMGCSRRPRVMYCADIDAQCRSVLKETCQVLSCAASWEDLEMAAPKMGTPTTIT